MTEVADADEMRGGHRRRRLAMLLAAAVIAVALLLLWWQRTPIAEHFVERQLDARGAHATYKIAQIAVRTQRIEDLVLGDPAHPDLVARSVEVDLSYASIVPRVAAIRARGVRLFGRIDDKGLHLGELDKFRDPSSTSPLGLPDIDLTLDDAGMRLETPAGPVGIVARGDGNLQSGFAGKVAALIRNAAVAGCTSPRASAWLDIHMRNGAMQLSGPVRTDVLRCDGGSMGAADLSLTADVSISKAFDRWTGRLSGGAEAARGAGTTFARPAIDMRFDGTADGQLRGNGTLSAGALRRGGTRAGRSDVRAAWNWQNDGRLSAQGRIRMADVRGIDEGALRNAAASMAATPVGPLAARLAQGVSALHRGNRLQGDFTLDRSDRGGEIRFTTLDLRGARGARLGLGSGSSLNLSLPDARWALNGSISGGGGGLPQMALRLTRAENGGFSGQMFVEPYAAEGARLDLGTVRFTARPGGTTRIVAQVRLDGPMPDGQLRGLDFPLTAIVGRAGDVVINPACAPLHFEELRTGPMRLGAATMRLCPEGNALVSVRGGTIGGGAVVAEPRLSGRMGETPLQLSASSARWSVGSGGFALVDADMRLGERGETVQLSAARLDGGAEDGGFGGQASGIDAKIGAVPLLVREGDARWRYAGGVLALDGRILVLDEANPDRFNPLESPDFRLTLADSRIDAKGTLRLPGGTRTIAAVTIRHMLDDGRGHVDLLVDALRFDKQLQPDEITHIALGVVANVFGTVDGRGRIDWTPDGVTSSGDFSTEGLNLAAAFGPVEGLSTSIHFTDLLGLETAPGQEMRLAVVNPGIIVRDGLIRYRLLPGQRVAIESGHWPFAGGDLTLLPTQMDMSSEAPRHLTFRILGLDAGAFIQLLELENISATGTFDGLLPMVFDADGGQIVGGVITARQNGMPPFIIDRIEGLDIPCDRNRQGGRLSYVGQVSNEDVGFMGKVAFDALKDLQYKCLTILMDGAIDGEVVTQVAFNGVNRGELSSVPKPIASQFIGLPFIFNVKIEAPFRGLLNTARSFYDPGLLVRQQLGEQVTTVRENRLAVQPRESDTMPPREGK
ncbi:MAG: YdbH domain-containing protein [Sphingobium sp.]